MPKRKNPEIKTEKELLQELIDKVDKLIVISGMQGNFDRTYLKKLSKGGFNQYELQNITGIDQADISRELKGIKKRKKKKND
ncbi:MAG: hypothetical protein Q7S06_00610 [Nanoarchaeota archaeon]|nr:hypothetical protein [Nanoarchaeota archaeon]